MNKYLKHTWRVLEHKFWVGVYAHQLNVSWWRIIKHDISKFGLIEFRAYANNFFKANPSLRDKVRFERVWIHHYIVNDHHWEHWLSNGIPQEMPEPCVREMVADWLGASRVYGGQAVQSIGTWSWWQSNKDRIKLHEHTQKLVASVMLEILPLDDSLREPSADANWLDPFGIINAMQRISQSLHVAPALT